MALMSNLKKPCTPRATLGKEKTVTFTTPKSALSVIQHCRKTGDDSEFLTIVEALSRSDTLAEQALWISQMGDCAALLDRSLDKLVFNFLDIPWYKNQELKVKYRNFIVNLATAHNYYTYHILLRLFTALIPDVRKDEEEKLLMTAGEVTGEEDSCHRSILDFIIAINTEIPLSKIHLKQLAKKCMPYFRHHVHKHAVYTRNLLRLAARLPDLRVSILEVIISNMMTIDVNTPRSELIFEDDDEEEEEEQEEAVSNDEEETFSMEVDDSRENKQNINNALNEKNEIRPMSHVEGNRLDVLMSVMLQYVHDICHGRQEPQYSSQSIEAEDVYSKMPQLVKYDYSCRPGKATVNETDKKRTDGCECRGRKHDLEPLKRLFNDLKDLFGHIILNTHRSSHVQFLIFYILALRPGLTTHFLEYLRVKVFEDMSNSRDVRRNGMSYIGSLLARGKFVAFSQVHSCMEIICQWCHAYIDNQERIHSTYFEDLFLHAPFYYACQTVFYVFTFRYKEYTENSKKLEWARNLNMERLVLSPLNPLKMCAPPVVSNFAAVTRRFQLAYCYTIIENNSRSQLPTISVDGSRTNANDKLDLLVPFDPYLLRRSRIYIIEHYREFEGLPEDISQSSDNGMDTDDEAPDSCISPKSFDFTYGTSPGYKSWSGVLYPQDPKTV